MARCVAASRIGMARSLPNTMTASLGEDEREGEGMSGQVRWEDWEDVTVTDWEDVGEFAVSREFNDEILFALGDDSGRYRAGSAGTGVPLVHPGALAQSVLKLLIEGQYAMREKPDQATLHAGQDSTLYRPVLVGEKLRAETRLADKYDRRNKKWVVYEARLVGADGKPAYEYRQVRMLRDDTEGGAGRARPEGQEEPS